MSSIDRPPKSSADWEWAAAAQSVCIEFVGGPSMLSLLQRRENMPVPFVCVTVCVRESDRGSTTASDSAVFGWFLPRCANLGVSVILFILPEHEKAEDATPRDSTHASLSLAALPGHVERNARVIHRAFANSSLPPVTLSCLPCARAL